jgi:predicted site-specific integrase-resolvase
VELLTPAEVAKLLKISVKTLAQWRSQRKGPAYVKINGGVRYKHADIENWLNNRKRGKKS